LPELKHVLVDRRRANGRAGEHQRARAGPQLRELRHLGKDRWRLEKRLKNPGGVTVTTRSQENRGIPPEGLPRLRPPAGAWDNIPQFPWKVSTLDSQKGCTGRGIIHARPGRLVAAKRCQIPPFSCLLLKTSGL